VAKKKVSRAGIVGDPHRDQVKRLTRGFMKKLERPLGLERTGNALTDRRRDDRYVMLWGLIEDLVEEAIRTNVIRVARKEPRTRGRNERERAA
jgi:hypothetical protein